MWSEPTVLNRLEGVALTYPLIATPIGSGIRFMTDNCGTPREITGNALVNDYVRGEIEKYGMDGLDGTIQVSGGTHPYDAVVALGEKKGRIDFEYFVQDVSDTGLKYWERCDLESVVPAPRPDWLTLAEAVTVHDAEGAESYWKQVGLGGFVGITLKAPWCHYMTGLTPMNFMEHLEYTKWVKGVAKAVGFTGIGNKLDYITCEDPSTKLTFDIAGGFTPKQRTDIWRDRQVYNKFTVRYECQPLGTDVPLNARFKKISKR